MFWNVVLEKDGDQLERSFDKSKVLHSDREKEYTTYNKKKEG